MIDDDGDIIRGLGYVVMYAAHLEARIDDILFVLSPLENYTEDEQRWSTSQKIKKAKSIISTINSPVASQIAEDLEICKEHFEWRNEVVHGRIYSPEYHEKNLFSARANVPNRRADSAELYMLANNLDKLNGRLNWPLSLPRLVTEKLNENA